MFDLCIIGAGMYGSSAARHASAARGVKVAVVDPLEPKDNEMAEREIFSSHYDEGRITSALDDCSVYHELSKGLETKYQELEKLSGVKFYNPVGFMCIAPSDSPILKVMVERSSEREIPLSSLCSCSDIMKRFPFLAVESHERAILQERCCGWLSARKFVAAQRKVAETNGCTFFTDTVTEIKPLQHEKIDSDDESIISFHEVHTASGKIIHGRKILICAGAFTNFTQLLPPLAVRSRPAFPDITVYKETVAMVSITEEEARRLSTMPTIACYRTVGLKNCHIGTYILPPIRYPDNEYYLKIGHLNNDDGDIADTQADVKQWYLNGGDPSLVKGLSQILLDLLPGVSPVEIRGASCVTCRSASSVPYIDYVTDTVLLAVVGNGSGAKVAEEVGRLAAELSIKGKWDSPIPKSVFSTTWKTCSE